MCDDVIPKQFFPDVTAVDALYHAAKALVELGENPNTVLMGRMPEAHQVLAAAVARMEEGKQP